MAVNGKADLSKVIVKGSYIGGHYYRFNPTVYGSGNIGIRYFMRKYSIRVKRPKHIDMDKLYKSRFSSMVARCKKKNLEYDIDMAYIKHLIHLPCEYCGASEKLSEIDRKDSKIGYINGNLVPACRRCNTIKNNVVSYDEMMFIAGYLGWRK